MGRGSHTLQVWHRPGQRPYQPRTLEELLDRVVVCPSGCWLWAGGQSGNGYGRILRPGTRNAMAAHRYVYEILVGRIPRGFQVDHLCRMWAVDAAAAFRSRLCCNPAHLEAVPHLVNQQRRAAANRKPEPAFDPDAGKSFEQLLIESVDGVAA